MTLEACKKFMDWMEYGFDDLYHGKYSRAYKKKKALDLEPGCSKDRIPCEKFRVAAAEKAFEDALARAANFYPSAFVNFGAMKEIVSCGKITRAWMFFAARCLFDRLGELMGPDGLVERCIAIGQFKQLEKKIPKTGRDAAEHKAAKIEFEHKVRIFESTASHIYEVSVLVPKILRACADFCKFSPEARTPQISRLDPTEACEIARGMEEVCLFVMRYFPPSSSVTPVRFSEYAQASLLPMWTEARNNRLVKDIVREIRARKMTGPGDPKFAKMLRLNAFLA